ncbi:MAG TPA: response regulator [Patescibacteria group bacterium]|nr:response regulator [Patescibacteria group bacterium]
MAKTVLIAEDEPSLLSILKRKIAGLGYEVKTATDGEAVIEIIKSQPVDLLLLDIIMPKKNGLQVLQELRVNLASKTPVIILSNLDSAEDIQTVKGYGVKEYIVKSQISIRQLSLQIARILQG